MRIGRRLRCLGPWELSTVTMIFRLSQKLATKLKVKRRDVLALEENPLADWSAHLFMAGRTQYILLANTKSLYSTLILGKGISNEKDFIQCAANGIRAQLERTDYQRLVVPSNEAVRFAKALGRSVTGSFNDMTKHAAYWLANEVPPSEIGLRLSDIPMSGLRSSFSSHVFPKDVFEEIVRGSVK
jgi:hypothetical protein